MNSNSRRVSYVFLCMVPFVAILAGALAPSAYRHLSDDWRRTLVACLIAAWILGGGRSEAARTGSNGWRSLAVFSSCLLHSLRSCGWALVPLGATPPDNLMRYLALLVVR